MQAKAILYNSTDNSGYTSDILWHGDNTKLGLYLNNSTELFLIHSIQSSLSVFDTVSNSLITLYGSIFLNIGGSFDSTIYADYGFPL